MERVAALAAAQAMQLQFLAADEHFSGFRQTGTISAFDFKVPDSGYLAVAALKLRAKFLERGILLRPLGNTIYVMPPYCITPDELKHVYDAVRAVARDGV